MLACLKNGLRKPAFGLVPSVFFCGVLAGFLACAFAGRAISQRPVLGDLPRLHDYLGPITAFYPTASEVIAMAAARTSPQRVTVIVGGNSVFHGAGQSVGQLWTRRLQELLGPGYQVSNLALKGGGPLGGAGSMAAEALTKRGHRVLFVTNTFPGDPVAPFGRPPFDYISWEAIEKGLLMHFPERAKFLRQRARTHPDEAADEMRLRMRLDRFCHFNDLWTAVSYRVGNTVWERNTNQRFFLPRTKFPDDERALRGGQPLAPEHANDAVKTLRRIAAEPDFGIADARLALPDVLRKRSLVVLSARTPVLLEKLDPPEREAYARAYENARREWERAGYRSFDSSADLLVADDFWDAVHLTPSGGEKIAHAIAPLIREIAAREFPQP